jgi:hypothetical protein
MCALALAKAFAEAARRRPDHVIAIAEHTCDDVERITGIRRDQVSVVHHGVQHLGVPA